MIPYAVTPVGALGPVESRTQLVYGPKLRDGATRAELARRVAVLTVENDDLRKRVEAVDRITQRWEDEAANRVKAQCQLNHAMRVFDVIAKLYPPLRPVIDRARKDIWG